MSKGRVIAMTPDPALGKALRAAVTAAGAEVRDVTSPAEIGSGPVAADLLVYHWARAGEEGDELGGNLDLALVADLADRLPARSHVIVLLPRGDLATSVAAMQAHARIAGVLVADRMRLSELTAMTTRLLHGNIFGLDKVLPWGARVHSFLVGDRAEKSEAVRQVSNFAAAVGLRRIHRERIERCCDEMIMNALYDAPAADDAPHGPSPGSGGSLDPEDRALVEFGCDGNRFAVAVRDRFGRFERATLLEYLDRCLHSEKQIEEKPGGAGLGLYFMSRSASSLIFNLLPGTATECVCTFDVEAPRPDLDLIGVFHERVDEVGRLAPQPARTGFYPVERRRAAPRAAAQAALLTEVIPRLSRGPWPRRAREWDERELDEQRRRDRTEEVEPPARGIAQRLRARLGLSPRGTDLPTDRRRSFAAAVMLLVFGLAGLAVGVPRMLARRHATPAQAPVSAGGTIAPVRGGSLTITANVPSRVTVEGSAACRNRPVPLEYCPLPDGRHTVVIESEELHLRHSFSVEVRGQPVRRDMRLGYVEARPGYRLRASPDQRPVARIALPEGRQKVTLMNQAPGSALDLQVPVRSDQTVLVP